MMMSALLNPKKVEVMIKKHYDKQAISEELGLSLEELDLELHKIYNDKSFTDISRRLKSNEKKARKEHAKSKKQQKAELNQEENQLEFEVEVSPAYILEPAEITLEDVLTSIEDKKAMLINLERRHDASQSNRNIIRKKIDVRKKDLIKIQERLVQYQNEVEALISEYDAEYEKMQEFTAQISEVRNELNELESKKEQLQTISVIVYSDGNIEINNELIMSETIPDDWKAIYQSFYGNDALDALTGAQQKSLAKLFVKLKSLSQELKVEVCCESNDMQAAYETLKGGILS